MITKTLNHRIYFGHFDEKNDINPLTKKGGVAIYGKNQKCRLFFAKLFNKTLRLVIDKEVYFLNKNSLKKWMKRHQATFQKANVFSQILNILIQEKKAPIIANIFPLLNEEQISKLVDQAMSISKLKEIAVIYPKAIPFISTSKILSLSHELDLDFVKLLKPNQLKELIPQLKLANFSKDFLNYVSEYLSSEQKKLLISFKNVPSEAIENVLKKAKTTLKLSDGYRFFLGGNHNQYEFIVKKLAEDEFSIGLVGKFLGKGELGGVKSALLNTGEEVAIKFAHSYEMEEMNEQAKEIWSDRSKASIQKEYFFLKTLNQNGPVWGIQRPIKDVVTDQKGDIIGFVGALYKDGDYGKCINSKKSFHTNIVREFDQLLNGFSFLHQNNYLHRDVKPDNFLCDGNEVHMADLGSLVHAHDKNESLIPHYSNPLYVSEQERLLNGDLAKNPATLEMAIQNEKAHDIFGLGIVFYLRLSNGNYPFQLNGNQYPIINTLAQLPETLPKELRDIVYGMLDQTVGKRLTAPQALKQLRDYEKKHVPTLYEEIQEAIKIDYPSTT